MLSSVSKPIAEERTLKFAELFFEAVGSERALGLKEAVSKRDYASILAASVDPRDYRSYASFAADYASVNLLSKIEGLDLGVDRVQVALSSFKAAERRCESTNIRLMNLRQENPEFWRLIELARVKIEETIGKCPDVREIIGLMRWGPGATATIKGDAVRPENKMLEPQLSVTPKALWLAKRVVGLDLHWARARLGPDVMGPCTLLDREFAVCEYMRVVTVPKSSKTDRTIGVEPTMNTYLQQGVGRLLKRMLKRVGINLKDQTWNQTLALVADRLNLCTIDLKSASDTLSYWLVEFLLPPAWFRLLDMLRSGYAMYEGKRIPLEKFSSMGNAFTFELESLIFWALSWACCTDDEIPTEYLSIFGDDIIVDRRAYGKIERLFRVCGFVINTDKTYTQGQFFESCGLHAFNGAVVTPLYQKELLYGLPELVRAHNRLCRWCERIGFSPSRFARALSYLRQEAKAQAALIPNGDKVGVRVPRVPYGTEGDQGFWTKNLLVQWVDGRALLDVLEEVNSDVSSISDESLLAIALKRTAQPSGPTDGEIPSWGEEGSVGASTYVVPPLRHLDEHEAFDGLVGVRGEPVYRVRRRWVEYRGTPVWVSALSSTRFLVVDDWLTIRALIPQLRGEARLN